MPGVPLGSKDTTVNKQSPHPHGIHTLMGGIKKKNKYIDTSIYTR